MIKKYSFIKYKGKKIFFSHAKGKNTFVFIVLVVFLTMYGPKFAPNLPNHIKQLFENQFFRALIIFLILYLSNKNMAISLMMTILFFFVMTLLNKHLSENFMIRYGAPLSNCKNYKKEDIDAAKGVYYPLHSDEKNL